VRDKIRPFCARRRRHGGAAARRHGGTAARRHGGTAVAGLTAVDVLLVEHVYRSEGGADRGGQGVDVGFGAGGDDRAGVTQDDISLEHGLEHPWRGPDQQVLFQRHA
jgi:hypothetical protein